MKRLKRMTATAVGSMFIAMALIGLASVEAAAKNKEPFDRGYVSPLRTIRSQRPASFVQGVYRDASSRRPASAFEANPDRPYVVGFRSPQSSPVLGAATAGRGLRSQTGQIAGSNPNNRPGGNSRRSNLLPDMEQGNLYR